MKQFVASYVVMAMVALLGHGWIPMILGAEIDDMPSSQTNSTKPTTIEYINPRSPITVASGKHFSLLLSANPTTGYQWQMTQPADEKVVKFLKKDYSSNNDQRVGSGGYEIWTFKAVGRGKARIPMKYIRPWEKDAVPAKQETYVIIVE